MTFAIANLLLAALLSADAPAAEVPAFTELHEKGIQMSDGSRVKLPRPILADGLDAEGQRAALAKVADARSPVDRLLAKDSAPVVVKVRNVKTSDGEGPTVRAIDTWFVAHGNWDTLTSKDFLESVMKTKDEGKSQTVGKSGILTDEEIAKRELAVNVKEGLEERFLYSTFSLFDRVEISATRFGVLQSGKDSVLAFARVDPRFDKDPDYPNQWRPIVRNEQAEITFGPPHLFAHAGGYSKITRLKEPADAVFIECHLVYEEPYAWFDGINLVNQKARPMINEKVRTFRRKLAAASEEKDAKSEKREGKDRDAKDKE
jgi:hypothetical protein